MTVFNCLPVQAAWDPTVRDATCLATRIIYLGGSIPNVITDVILVAMPLPYVWRLHAPLTQRLMLAAMFALGVFIAIVSLVRLIVFVQIPLSTAGDVTYNFREVIVWSIVEVNIGLTCTCLPSPKPAFALVGLNKLFASSGSARPSNGQPYRPSEQWPGYKQYHRSLTPRKKGATGGLFSTLAGSTRTGSDEEVEMIDKSSHGTARTEIEGTRMCDRPRPEAVPRGAIQVQKDWGVFVNYSRGQRG